MPRRRQLKKGGRGHDMPTGVNTFHNQRDSTEEKKEDEKIANSPKADGAERCVEEEEEGGSGQGDWEIILKTSVELLGQIFGGAEVKQNTEETGAKAKDVKARRRERRAPVKDERAGSGEAIATLTQGDYLQLLKLLNIKLPEGVVTEQVIELANTESSIQVAEDILQELEKLFIRFKVVPRLRCCEVKRYLDLKKDRQLLQITKLLFFEKEDDKQKGEEQWRKNKTNTGQGFRLRDKYMDDTAISTPKMYSTAKTRSWGKLEVGQDTPKVTGGTRVKLSEIEERDYCDESDLWKNGPGQFGMFSTNKRDELEMLKFFHELRKLNAVYTKGNKVEYGFLTGCLDFLAQQRLKSGKLSNERLVIECKSTTGDMVGKVFSKKPKGVHAKIFKCHEYNFQVQAYMYILNKEAEGTQLLQMKRAVMVVRHYHQEGSPPRDFGRGYLQIDASVQEQIKQLRIFCQEEVLACYLALLNLIFQKETV